MDDRADVIVIGMGPGGEDVAGQLAEAGLDVIGIDAELVGGECPYWGCVPSKMMIRAANVLAEARRIPILAGAATVEPSWAPVAKRIRDEATANWDDQVAVERFESKGGRFVRGRARLAGPGRVDVEGRLLEASRGIVVATGTHAAVPPIPGLADVGYWINRDAIKTEAVPDSLLVLGGGAIGCELAQVFARFGATVTVIEAMDRLLPPEEPEAGELIAAVFDGEGIDVRTGEGATEVRQDGTGGPITVVLGDGTELRGARLLVATGRRVDLAAIGVASIGLDESARSLPVDERCRVTDGIWAVGDVTGEGAFTHIAVYQAEIAVRDILGRDGPAADYRGSARVTFTDPEVGSVGVTAATARERGTPVKIGMSQIPSSARGWIHKAGNEGFIKLVADADRDVLIGATSAGPTGGEVLSMLTLAVHAELPLDRLRTMIYAYPTFHRAVQDALRDLDAD